MSGTYHAPQHENDRSIYLVSDSSRRTFTRDETFDGLVREHPVVLDCPDLGTAQKYSQNLRLTDDLDPLPILRVHAVSISEPPVSRVSIPAQAKSVVSLAIDLNLLGIARGLVLVHDDSGTSAVFASEVEQLLNAAGYKLRSEVPGWHLTTEPDAHAPLAL